MQKGRNLSWVGVVLGLILAAMVLTGASAAQQPPAPPPPAKAPGQAGSGPWRDVGEGSIALQGTRAIIPAKYRTLAVDETALAATLAAAPLEATTKVPASPAVLALPLPDGSFGRFRFVQSPIMEPGLAAKFPAITTYLGQGLDDP